MPDPYRVWLSEIMLQQTTVATVGAYFARFTERWPTVEDLAAADDAVVLGEWAGLGYYARARNLLKCARAVVARGEFPQTCEDLQSLPGIGPYTAAAIAAIAFDEQATVVDGNVERVVSRLFAIDTPLPSAKGQIREAARTLTPPVRAGCFAQAMMDLGATVCKSRKPLCDICPLSANCAAHAQGIAETLPVKAKKKAKPTRLGHVYVLRHTNDAVLVETRPQTGLLGGMTGFPGSDWAQDLPPFDPPVDADWRQTGTIRHTFTHFHLLLTVHMATAPKGFRPRNARFLPKSAFDPEALPTLMRKVWAATKEGIHA